MRISLNDLNKAELNSLEWLAYIEKISASTVSGHFSANNGFDAPILIEWEKINPHSSRLSEKITSLSDLLVQSYSQIEIQFARKHPEAVPNELFLKPLESLFKDGLENVDWNLVEEKMKINLKEFLISTDWGKYSGANDIHFFVTAKDKQTEALIGMIQFIATPEFPYGNFKIALYDGVMPIRNNCNLEKLLMSTIFKLLPTTKRLFFHTRITNESAIDSHRSIGFTPFPGNLDNWIDLEYIAKHTDILQEMAKLL